MKKDIEFSQMASFGIFSAIYFVINFAFMVMGGIHPIMWMLMPGLSECHTYILFYPDLRIGSSGYQKIQVENIPVQEIPLGLCWRRLWRLQRSGSLPVQGGRRDHSARSRRLLFQKKSVYLK